VTRTRGRKFFSLPKRVKPQNYLDPLVILEDEKETQQHDFETKCEFEVKTNKK
jgi:hypothetical protein